MKPIISKLLNATPLIIGIAIVAYIIEELVEDFGNESLSDFVYPIATLVILYILWKKVIPTVQAYLNEGPAEEKAIDNK
jgi:hypothetical protein